MNASFCASIVACAAALLASGNPLQAQIDGGVPPYAPGAEMYAQPCYPPAVGYADPGYSTGGPLLPSECSTEELLWFRGEYLLWWIKNADIPPLVATGPESDLLAGVLGRPGTRVLFGDELDYGDFNGARFTVGSWLDEYRTFGVELNYFFLDRGSDGFAAASTGSPILARPYFEVSTGTPAAKYVAAPAFTSGRIDIASSSRLMGAEINGLLSPWYEDPLGSENGHLDLLFGFRYVDLDEHLRMDEQVTLFAAPPGFRTDAFDSFDARNRFYGGQAGLQWQARRGRASVRLTGKLALGATHQNVDVGGGSFVRLGSFGTVPVPGGVLVQPTNIGDYSRDRFSVIPEVGAYLGYDVLEGLSLYAGYTFLYWTNVARPGDQIDPAINITQVIGPALVGEPRPAFSFRDTDFWAQGLSIGAALTF